MTLQKPYRNTLPKEVDIYVGIPFCLTRCSYCSFTGGEITKMQQYVKPYYDTLSKEIKATLDIVKRGGYKIKNISAVIMAEKPKLLNHIPTITLSLSKALGISQDMIGISATTLEGIGIVGREEGICVNATATLKKIGL